MKVGIVCYPTFGGSGVVATELGLALANEGHSVHFITYSQPTRFDHFNENLFYHEVDVVTYPLFQYPPYVLALASKMVDVVKYEKLDLLHVHYAIPHATSAFLAREIVFDAVIHKEKKLTQTSLSLWALVSTHLPSPSLGRVEAEERGFGEGLLASVC